MIFKLIAGEENISAEGGLNAIAEGTLLVKVAEIVGMDLSKAEELPYVLIEVDKNEVLIKASSMDTKSIHLIQKATLYIFF